MWTKMVDVDRLTCVGGVGELMEMEDGSVGLDWLLQFRFIGNTVFLTCIC